jgi:hypothetical protein
LALDADVIGLIAITLPLMLCGIVCAKSKAEPSVVINTTATAKTDERMATIFFVNKVC